MYSYIYDPIVPKDVADYFVRAEPTYSTISGRDDIRYSVYSYQQQIQELNKRITTLEHELNKAKKPFNCSSLL